MTKPICRATRIDLDEDEMPETVHLLMSDDVVRRVREEFDLEVTSGVHALLAARLPMAILADMGRHLGRISGLDAAVVESYYCVANLANRFWDNGLNEAPSAGLRARGTAEAARG